MNTSNLNLSPTEKRTIQALLIALMELDSPLSADLQGNVDDIGQFLTTNSEVAFSRLQNLIDKDDRLKNLYEKARENLQQEYSVRERDKSEAIAQSLPFNDLMMDSLILH